MIAAVPWLPESAFTAEALSAVFEKPLDLWSKRWFVRARAQVARVRPERDEASPPALVVEDEGTRLELSARGKRHVLETALRLDLAEVSHTRQDNLLLDLLVQEMLEDLHRGIAALFADAAAENTRKIRAALSLGRTEILEMRLPAAWLVPLLKQHYPRAAPSGKRLRTRNEAFKGSKVSARACLGRVEIALEDLQNLALGDVLVLDRHLSDPIDMCFPGSDKAFLRGALRRDGDRIVLQL